MALSSLIKGIGSAAIVVTVAAFSTISTHAADSGAPAWDQKSAAAYLDSRATWWAAWPKAARDHDTFCVSCHTTLPYLVSRSSLRVRGSEPTASERKLLDNLSTRVQRWQEVQSFYPDSGGLPRSHQSRVTEAVLNALILVQYDKDKAELGETAKAALGNMWALQEKTGEQAGSFPWLNFNNEPWEAPDSPYFGNSLAALAVGSTPASYRKDPEIQRNMLSLNAWLQREFAAQTEINRAFALWAMSKNPGLLTVEQVQTFKDEAFRKQQPDGGWSLSSLIGTWKRRDGAALEQKSDGYATALMTLALESASVPRGDAHLKKSLDWLVANQDKTTGSWMAWSPNLNRDPASDPARFLPDAATAYAVLALTYQ
jgi:squalene-hopene/tetraprenyl-beta-curcumene cyclase